MTFKGSFVCRTIQKVNVKLSLLLISHHGMETYGRMDVYLHIFLTSVLDRAIVQAVSRRLPPIVRSQVRSCGICDGQSDTGAGVLRVLQFPLPILIPSNVQYP
jgi:hypothetical protein